MKAIAINPKIQGVQLISNRKKKSLKKEAKQIS